MEIPKDNFFAKNLIDHLGQWFSNCEFQTPIFNCPWCPLPTSAEVGRGGSQMLFPAREHKISPLHSIINISFELCLRLYLNKVFKCFFL